MPKKIPIYRYNRLLHERNLGEEIIDIIAYDMDNTCEKIEDRGLIFLLTLLLIIPITIAEIIYCCWTYYFDKKDMGYTSLASIWRDELSTAEGLASNVNSNTEQQITKKFAEIEKFEEIKHPYIKSKKKQKIKVEALINLRDILLLGKGILKGHVVKTIQRKVPDEVLQEDAKTGIVSTIYWTDYIDFGKNVNEYLKEILKDKITLKKVKGIPYKCLEINNGDTDIITNNLKRIFLQDSIKIKFDTDRNNLYNK